jgi:hypothetical protein
VSLIQLYAFQNKNQQMECTTGAMT